MSDAIQPTLDKYRNTGNSLVAVMLTHGMVNASHPLLPVISAPGAGHNEYLYWALANVVVALAITKIYGAATLTGRKVRQ